MSRWSLFVLLFALLAAPAGAQIIPSGPNGSINYWGPSGSSQVLVPGTAGQCLTTQGTTGAPVWVNCQVSSLSLLPPINTNQFYGNVSGQFSPPVGVDVNTILNTVGYDIVRPPTPESIIYKSNVGPLFNWQALPPGASGSILTSGGATNPPFWSASTVQASLAAICQTIGAVLYFDTPSLTWKCLNPGTAGQVLRTGGANGNPSYLTLAPSATTDTTNASNITSGTLPASVLPTPTASSLGGIFSATAPANQFMTGVSTSGAPTFGAIPANSVSNSMLAQAPPDTVKGNCTGSTANVQDCTNPLVAGITLNPTAATTNQGVAVTQSGPTSGNQNAQVNFNSINITSDQTNTGSSSNTVNGLSVSLSSGGANAAGARQAGFFQTIQSQTSATNPNRNYVGAVGVGTCATDGGTGVTLATAKGGCFGGNFVAQTAGVDWLDIDGQENDVSILTGGSSVGRAGISLVSNGNVQASIADSAIRVAQGGGTIGWQTALLLSDLNSGVTPISTNGCVICTNFRAGPYTITTGIDLTGLTITGNIFNSSSFRVTGSGVFSRYTAVGGAPSVGSCTGLGTGSCAFVSGSQDNAGQIVLSPTGAPAATGSLTLTYSAALGTHGSACNFTTGNGTGGWTANPGFIAAATSNTSFTVAWTNGSGAALTAGSTYVVNYICMGF